MKASLKKFREALSPQRAAVKVAVMVDQHADMQEAARFAHGIRAVAAVATVGLFAAEPAMAQSLKQTAVDIFTYLYGIVGVVGAISVLVTGVNWATGNWLGREDPKKTFTSALLGTGLGLGSVALIEWLKKSVGGSASDIKNL